MTRGNSGSTVTVTRSRAYKKGGAVKHLRQQFDFIKAFSDAVPSLPRGAGWSGHGYSMERLEDVRRLDDDLLRDVRTTLQTDFWYKEVPVVLPWKERMIERYGIAVDFTGLPLCLTHGDPTLENCMRRKDGALVLIDPLPPINVPPVRAVDLGKLLQSYMGYERLRGDKRWALTDDALGIIFDGRPDHEQRVAWQFAGLHWLRCGRYLR